MSDVQTPGDVVAAAKASSRLGRLLPVFTVPPQASTAAVQRVADQVRHAIENGEQIVLDGITLQFVEREPGQTTTFEIRTS